MMKKFLATLGVLAALALPGFAQERNKVYGWCQQGGVTVVTAATSSTNKVQGSFPSNCQIRVFNAGTLVNATIFSDSSGTPLANPFTANGTTGFWQFYVVAGSKVDVQVSATGLSTYTIGDIWVSPTAFSGITGTGTAGKLPKWATASSLTDSILTETTGLITSSGSLDLATNNLRLQIVNDAVTGTIANRLVSLTGAPSTAIRTPLAATSGVIGIAVSGAGTTGSVSVAYAGRASCAFDAGTTAGQYVIPSSTGAGQCSATATPGLGTAAIGLVLSTNGGAGTYEVLLFGPDSRAQQFAGSNGEVLWNNNGTIDGISNSVATVNGEVRFSSSVRTSGGSTRYFMVTTPADTTLAADTESIGTQIGGFSNGSTVTRQWTAGGGTFSTQREFVFIAPGYAFTSNDTISDAATVAITGAPVAGTNATLTRSYGLWVQGGQSRFDGDLVDGSTGSTRIDIDASAFNGFPTIDIWLGPGPTGRVRMGQESITYSGGGPASTTRSISSQTIPDSTSGFGVFEAFNAGGAILGTGGNTNSVYFTVNRVVQAEFANGGQFYFGGGATDTTPQDGLIQGQGGSGSNVAGANLIFAAGKGTGNANPGRLLVKLPGRTGSGTTLQSLTGDNYFMGFLQYVLRADISVNTTTAETTFVSSGTSDGSLTIRAGTANVGSHYVLEAWGTSTTTGTPTIRIRTFIGGTQMTDTGAVTSPISGANGRFYLSVPFTVRSIGATGQAFCALASFRHINVSTGASQTFMEYVSAGAPTIDWTVDQTVDARITYGTSSASNAVTTFNATLTRFQ